jgi:hypothetical protein
LSEKAQCSKLVPTFLKDTSKVYFAVEMAHPWDLKTFRADIRGHLTDVHLTKDDKK